MKLFNDVSLNKIRGGFYTPLPLIQICINRIKNILKDKKDISILEPSIGDGAFLRYIINNDFSEKIEKFTGVEIIDDEVYKCRSLAKDANFRTQIFHDSLLNWIENQNELFDVVLGNPPFVRFQFISNHDINSISNISQKINIPFKGVSNLWIPILLSSLNSLKEGGCMAFVIPAEVFTGISAGTAREWILSHFEDIYIDMFDAGSFPDVLQEVVIISGKKINKDNNKKTNKVIFSHHHSNGNINNFEHHINICKDNWMKYMLSPNQIKALDEIKNINSFLPFNKVAKLEVSIVTGANDYFSVNSEQCKHYNLDQWVEPLLPKVRYANGIIYNNDDHVININNGIKSFLLNFSESHPNPELSEGSREYLELGKNLSINTRYKTSIRSQWYRIPSIWAGNILLSKRSHWFPRLIYNQAKVLTTDTIYRGKMNKGFEGYESSIITGFHNSMTLLLAEIEGRSFGGGVLELVPSEINKLLLPVINELGNHINEIDELYRKINSFNQDQNILVHKTNDILKKYIDIDNRTLIHIEEARLFLQKKRLERN